MQRSRQRLRRPPDGIPRVKGRRRRSRGERHTASGGRRNVAGADGDVRNRSGTSVTGSPTAPNRVSPIQRPSDVSGDRRLRRLHRRKRKSKRAALPNRRTLPPLAEYLCGDRRVASPKASALCRRAMSRCAAIAVDESWSRRAARASVRRTCAGQIGAHYGKVRTRRGRRAVGQRPLPVVQSAGQAAGKERQGSRSQVAGPSQPSCSGASYGQSGQRTRDSDRSQAGRAKTQGGKPREKAYGFRPRQSNKFSAFGRRLRARAATARRREEKSRSDGTGPFSPARKRHKCT